MRDKSSMPAVGPDTYGSETIDLTPEEVEKQKRDFEDFWDRIMGQAHEQGIIDAPMRTGSAQPVGRADATDAATETVGDDSPRGATAEGAQVEGAAPADDALVAESDAQAGEACDGETGEAGADPAGASEEPAPEETFEDRVERVRKTVNENPRFREIHYKTLGYCLDRHVLTEVEQMIAGLPEYPASDQNPYRLIAFLEVAGGLERFELDEQGNVVTPEMKEGLTDDEIDDLVCEYAFETTDAGRAVYDEMQPEKRMNKLFGSFPKRVQAYQDLLRFCTEPRTYKEIDKLFEGADVLKSGSLNTGTNVPLQPSVFVDQLERSGGLVWNGKWNVTESGKKLLAAMQEAAG